MGFRYKNIEIEWLGHASFKIIGRVVVCIDPYELSSPTTDTDLVLITHEHFDHYSLSDIKKVTKDAAVIVVPKSCKKAIEELRGLANYKLITIDIYDEEELNINGQIIKIKAYPAYNPSKQFHPKSNHWLGYLIIMDGVKIYHCGDTDLINEFNELRNQNIDLLLIPIGGTYTMNSEEAAQAAKIIKPKIAIPMHYGRIVGTEDDANNFKKLLEGSDIEVKIL